MDFLGDFFFHYYANQFICIYEFSNNTILIWLFCIRFYVFSLFFSFFWSFRFSIIIDIIFYGIIFVDQITFFHHRCGVICGIECIQPVIFSTDQPQKGTKYQKWKIKKKMKSYNEWVKMPCNIHLIPNSIIIDQTTALQYNSDACNFIISNACDTLFWTIIYRQSCIGFTISLYFLFFFLSFFKLLEHQLTYSICGFYFRCFSIHSFHLN